MIEAAPQPRQLVDFDGLVAAIVDEMAVEHDKLAWSRRKMGGGSVAPVRAALSRLRDLRRAQAELARTRDALAGLVRAAGAAVDAVPDSRKYLSALLADIEQAGLLPAACRTSANEP